MAKRYYLTAEQVCELSETLQCAEGASCSDLAGARKVVSILVEDVRRLAFATELPDDLAEQIERELVSTETV